MSTCGPAASSTRWPPPAPGTPTRFRCESDRRDVVDQPLAVDLLVIDAQPAAVIHRLFGLVGHGAVHVDHHRSAVALCRKHTDTHHIGLTDHLAFPRLRDD